MRMILKRVIPLNVSIWFDIGTFIGIMYCVSHYSKEEYYIGALGMGFMMYNFFLRSFVLGFNNSLSTLLSQAYGAKKYKEFADIINRARIFFGLLMIPLLIFIYFTGDFLILIGQPKNVAIQTGRYIRIAMLSGIFHLQYDIFRKFLTAIRKSNAYSYIPYVTCFVCIFLSWFFIKYLDLNVVGAGIVVFFSQLINLLLMIFTIYYYDINTYLFRWPDKDSFKGWSQLFQLGLPTFLLQISTFISTEFVILITGYVSTKILVANTTMLIIFYTFSVSGLSIQVIAAALIGNKIGEGDLNGTQLMIKATFIIGFIAISIVEVVYLFTSKFYTIQEMKTILPICMVMLASFMSRDIMIGVLIGLGLQKKTIYINIASYFLFGIPVSLYCTFRLNWYYYGPWIGIILATCLNTLCFYCIYKSRDLKDIIWNYKIGSPRNNL